jgi:hypothetical protein
MKMDSNNQQKILDNGQHKACAQKKKKKHIHIHIDRVLETKVGLFN